MIIPSSTFFSFSFFCFWSAFFRFTLLSFPSCSFFSFLACLMHKVLHFAIYANIRWLLLALASKTLILVTAQLAIFSILRKWLPWLSFPPLSLSLSTCLPLLSPLSWLSFWLFLFFSLWFTLVVFSPFAVRVSPSFRLTSPPPNRLLRLWLLLCFLFSQIMSALTTSALTRRAIPILLIFISIWLCSLSFPSGVLSLATCWKGWVRDRSICLNCSLFVSFSFPLCACFLFFSSLLLSSFSFYVFFCVSLLLLLVLRLLFCLLLPVVLVHDWCSKLIGLDDDFMP